MQSNDIRYSLHIRIIIFIALILGVGAVVLALAAWQYAGIAARDAYDKLLIGGTIQVAENVYMQGGVVTLDPPAAAFATLSAYDLVFYRVTDPRGVVVAGYGDLAPKISSGNIRKGVVLTDDIYQGQLVRIAAIGKQIDTDTGTGWVEIVVAQTLRAREALARDLAGKAVGMIAIMSLLALIAGAISVRIALKPLTRIEREIAARKPDDLRAIRVTPPYEIRALVSVLDDFMRRLADRIALMQRFIADAAHQMRTPLAELNAQVEILSNDADPKLQDQIQRLGAKVTELGNLTSQLLDHAMVIHRAGTVRFDTIDLNALAKATLAQAVPLSFEREVSIAFVPSENDLHILGDAISIREALTNLISNALRHGASTRLSVSVGQTDSEAWISVCDDGSGIPPTEQARLLTPFEVGRGQSAGTGLGLTIAAEVAKAHGGELSFVNSPDEFCVRLTLSTSKLR
ncbi:sensor histidine kinase [Phyllobacterium myrsinacearum]|uniref:histidine kinase n=1 Tax=Phyllobacterium myrsinacearum TaxID=28101 RepID=A0A839EFK2_9HYPH|nr:sensor histidine kinase [Phyllobacterium myrsinacearum]MBA8878933.1 two-component system sensor histidine kinase TctE [Phyllobacterium myrsinacearum]